MSAAHTPGPWIVCKSSIGGPTICADKSDIASVRTVGGVHCGGDQHPDTEANARLIAAAPELLEALQGIIRNQSADWPAIGFNLNAARAAIAKATGVAA